MTVTMFYDLRKGESLLRKRGARLKAIKDAGGVNDHCLEKRGRQLVITINYQNLSLLRR